MISFPFSFTFETFVMYHLLWGINVTDPISCQYMVDVVTASDDWL